MSIKLLYYHVKQCVRYFNNKYLYPSKKIIQNILVVVHFFLNIELHIYVVTCYLFVLDTCLLLKVMNHNLLKKKVIVLRICTTIPDMIQK